jgi:hypothetical protein
MRLDGPERRFGHLDKEAILLFPNEFGCTPCILVNILNKMFQINKNKMVLN